uniref:RING-type E3 ubiquitin transferase n=1 Tax=Acanthochromis polyacanthus TaxID=80966 RepID=A0A3Q1FHN7_9TELE
MGGKQSTAGRPRGAFPGVSTDDSAVPPSAHFGHYRPSGTMGLRKFLRTGFRLSWSFFKPKNTKPTIKHGGGSIMLCGTGAFHKVNGIMKKEDHLHVLQENLKPSRLQFSSTWSEHVGLFFSAGFKCPVCSKSVASNEMEVHFIMCLSKPRLSYNGQSGLCTKHVPCSCSCIDSWFEINRSCPEHPSD